MPLQFQWSYREVLKIGTSQILNKEISGIAIGSALHYQKISIKEIKNKISQLGFDVRLWKKQ